MGYVDLILNLSALLLWLNWRSIRFDPLTRRLPTTLMGTLRPASPAKLHRWHFLLFVLLLIILRGFLYRWLGPATGSFTTYLDFSVTSQGFRHDSLIQDLAFSVISFARFFILFYLVLIFIAILKGPQPIAGLIRIPLGRVYDWPLWALLVTPFLLASVAWGLGGWLIDELPPRIHTSGAIQFQGALVMGLCAYLTWKIPACIILTLHILNTYIYFGRHPFWNFISSLARRLLLPLQAAPLRVGRVDFAPLALMAILLLLFQAASQVLAWLYFHRLH